MQTYDFELVFELPGNNADPTKFTDALFETGCSDAVCGVGRAGSISLSFDRQAETLEGAVMTAIENVRAAVPQAKLIEANLSSTDTAQMLTGYCILDHYLQRMGKTSDDAADLWSYRRTGKSIYNWPPITTGPA